VEIIVLGAGTAVPHPSRHASGLVLAGDKHTVALDFGPGALGKYARAGLELDQLEAVFLSHLHLDHVHDLATLLFALHNATPSERPLHLLGPRGLGAHLDGMRAIYGSSLDPARPLVVEELLPGQRHVLACVEVEPFSAIHTPEALSAVLVFEGRRLLYSGDTGLHDELVRRAAGVELAICECSFPDGKGVPNHLTPAAVRELVDRSGCKRLLLTHRYPVMDDYELKPRFAELDWFVEAEDLTRLFLAEEAADSMDPIKERRGR